MRLIIEPREHWSDVLATELANAGFETFAESDEGLLAYIKAEDFNREEFDRIMDQFAHSFRWSVHISRIPHRNWNEIWEKGFEPVWIGKELVIRASFHKPSRNKGGMEIVIEPKMAFGTGHHDTTRMMMERMLKMDLKGKTVLDMGCGSGILSVLAEKLGASSVTALDIEEEAVLNTREHAIMNNCTRILVEKGGAEHLPAQGIDIILANINRNTLLALMKPFSSCLVHHGSLLLSGYFEADLPQLGAEASACGLQHAGGSVSGNWRSDLFIKQ